MKKGQKKTNELHYPNLKSDPLRSDGENDEKVELSEAEVVDLIEDLRVYQIELQSQNAQLKDAQKRLEEAHNKYLELYDFAPVAYFSFDEKGIIKQANLTSGAMLGFERQSLLASGFSRFLEPEHWGRFSRCKKDALETGHKQTCELKLNRKDGSPLFVQMEMVAEQDLYGKRSQVRAAAVDITDRKRIEEELIKSHKRESLGILADGIAHDFNNILMVIKGNIDLIKSEAGFDEKTSKCLDKVEKACQRASDITEQLLVFSKEDKPEKKPASVKDLLQVATSFALSGSNVKCDFNLPDDLWWAELDRGQISQVVNSIIQNAIQAMTDGGIIHVQGENVEFHPPNSLPLNSGRYIRISFRDQGTGIKNEDLPRIFDPYFTTKTNARGMGLAVAASVIKQHGGYITGDSVYQSGTTIDVYLPASNIKRIAAEVLHKDLLGKGRILLMDDDAMVREVSGRMLVTLGYEVDYASNGDEMIERYTWAIKKGIPFDAVILDLTIPGGIGAKESIKKLKQINPEIKAVVSSGYKETPLLEDYQRSGFAAVLAKPYSIEGLGKLMKNILSEEKY